MQRPVPRIKICCINSIEEAKLAITYGASAVGLVSNMPGGPGVISEELIQQIAATIPPGVASVLLTSQMDTGSIIDQQKCTGVNTIQLCDWLESGSYHDFRDTIPGISIMQVIHVTGPESVEQANRIAPHVNAILLDSGNPQLQVKKLGGTGRIHDWQISRRIVETVPVPVYLAGGLTPENIQHAIAAVRPFGVDVCSGLRTNGNLNEDKLKKFCTHVMSC
jgi:phosphoribosylanthranilate isomerase